MPHSPAVLRFGFVVAALGLAALSGCGSVRTELPASVSPGPTPTTVPTPLAEPSTEAETGPTTTASAFKSPGEKHPLAGGTLAASYPRVGVRPPKGATKPPAGQAWAVLNVRFCAAATGPIGGDLVDPNRFRVEVPGQGSVGPAPESPALSKTPLVAGTAVAAGTCTEGSIAYVIGGEGHIESIAYETGEGLLRWAT